MQSSLCDETSVGPDLRKGSDMGSINGYSVLVTGGGSGIGEAAAAKLAADGANVMICGRTEEKLIAAVERIKARAADGTTVAHPAYALGLTPGRVLENYGLAPTQLVDAAPHDAVRKLDAQLEEAISRAAELAAASRRALELRQAEEAVSLPSGRGGRAQQHWSMRAPEF